MKLTRTAAMAAAAATMFAAATPAAIASTYTNVKPTGGKIQIWLTEVNETKTKATITGAIGDYGTSVSEDKNGKVDPNGAYQLFKLKHGTILVDGSGLNKKFGSVRPVVNKANCSVTFALSGPVKITSGTGEYAGAHGKLTVHVSFAGLAQKTKKGCNLADNSPTYGPFGVITGSGSIAF